MRLLALALLLAACGPRYQPLAPAPEGFTQEGTAPPPGVEVALGIIAARAAPTHIGGLIVWHVGPIDLYGQPVYGYALLDDGPTFHVEADEGWPVYRTALTHEIYHYVWASQTGDVDTAGEGDPQFYAWIKETNAAIQAALEIP